MKVDRPGLCLLLADSSNSVILFRELEYVVIGALCLAKDKVKSGVAHILESHPHEQRARMGHPLSGSVKHKPEMGNRLGHPPNVSLNAGIRSVCPRFSEIRAPASPAGGLEQLYWVS